MPPKRKLAQAVVRDYDTVYTESVHRISIRLLAGSAGQVRLYDLHTAGVLSFTLDASSSVMAELRRIVPTIDVLPIGKLIDLSPMGSLTWRWVKGTAATHNTDRRALVAFTYPAGAMPTLTARNLPIWANSEYDLFIFADELHLTEVQIDSILGPNRTYWNEDREVCRRHVEAALVIGKQQMSDKPSAPTSHWSSDPKNNAKFWSAARSHWAIWHGGDGNVGSDDDFKAWVHSVAGVLSIRDYTDTGSTLLTLLLADARQRVSEQPVDRRKTIREMYTIKVQGKDYLKAEGRVLLMREDHPDWTIETDLVHVADDAAVTKATIRDGEGRILVTAHGYSNIQMAEKAHGHYVEKAETAAKARACAGVGYGTEYEDE